MTGRDLLDETAEDFYENAPCGFVSTRPDWTIVKANRTIEEWTGLSRDELLTKRFQDLLSPGGRIYHETHYAPLLEMQGSVQEIAVELVAADGSRRPALINSVLRRDETGRPQVIRTTVFDASDRRRYEEELLAARRREQDIAQELQRSMLTGTLPVTPGVTLDFSYRPAEQGLEVGGDWCDAFAAAENELGLVIGDVVGRGIKAAATMGQLRSALRALAATKLEPGPLLDALDAYSQQHEVGGMSTLVYAQLDPAARRLRYASAGHLPPAIAPPGDPPYLSWDGRSRPLDSHVGAERPPPREQAELELAPGTTVVAYTDGLVERRSRPLDAGMEQLLAELAADPQISAHTLLHRLRDPAHADDVCVLIARLDR